MDDTCGQDLVIFRFYELEKSLIENTKLGSFEVLTLIIPLFLQSVTKTLAKMRVFGCNLMTTSKKEGAFPRLVVI